MTISSEQSPISATSQPDALQVSIIMPCRNEAGWIRKCLESVAANDFPKDHLELLVLDGMSDDGTPAIVEEFTAAHPWVRLLENPRKTAPAALNIGIAAARGKVIMRMDAHTEYSPDYISKLIHWLDKSGADNVGGLCITLPSADTSKARAIALGESHPFGVGNSLFRLGVSEPCWTETVPFGCYRRDVFDRIGFFDEELVRNQDIEFNLRLRRAGGKILLVPDVASRYYTRPSFRKLWRTHYQNGYFNVLVIRKMKGRITFRQAIPPLFVIALLTTGVLSPWFWWMRVMFAACLTAYLIPLVTCSLIAAARHGPRVGLSLAAVFPTLHFSNGFGTLVGIWNFQILHGSAAAKNADIPITR